MTVFEINFHDFNDLVSSDFIRHLTCNLCIYFIPQRIISSERRVSLSELEKWDIRAFKDHVLLNTNAGSLDKSRDLYLPGVYIYI